MTTPAPAPRAVTLLCARCGQPAAVFRLLAGDPADTSQFGRSDRLERTGFMGTVTQFGAYPQLARWLTVLAEPDFAAARQMDPDLVAFHCRACGQVYCEQCWSSPRLVFDDGFYDCAYATCPHGHEQIVDD